MNRRWLDLVRTSFWFVPILMMGGAILLAVTTLWVDRSWGEDTLDRFGWLYNHSPAGARTLLQSVATSMITTAGVVFSIMVVVLALAANQFGSRLVRNYMRDRQNQITLGTFVATFVFCLIVMRAVLDADDRSFVPHVSMFVALVLAIASVCVLVFFIHHITQTIQSEHILAEVTADLEQEINSVLPDHKGPQDSRPGADFPQEFSSAALNVTAAKAGYIQMIDVSALVRCAAESDLYIECLHRAGDFVRKDTAVARYMRAGNQHTDWAPSIRREFAIGTYRTYLQDIDFAVQQIVLIMTRAMSPGINDPFTAIACLDRLGEVIVILASRAPVQTRHFDSEGRLRVCLQEINIAALVDATLAAARQAARSNGLVSIHYMRTLRRILEGVDARDVLAVLRRQAYLALKDNEQTMKVASDLEELQREYQRLIDTADRPAA